MACEILVYSHLSTTTRDWIHVPCIGRWILKHCTTEEVLQFLDVSILDVTSWFCCCQFSSVQSLSRVQLFAISWTTARHPTPRVYPNSCPLSQWCHPTISSSVTLFSSCLPSFPESASFPMSQLFASGGQSIGVLASTSVLPMNTQDWSPLGWTGWISLQSKGPSKVFSNVFEYRSFLCIIFRILLSQKD